MRFFLDPNPKLDDERTITKFLLFPVCINNEMRWLEKATIKQKFKRIDKELENGEWCFSIGWKDIEFIDNKDNGCKC